MLTELRIRNFAIIESLTLPLGGGFNVLSGETGEGGPDAEDMAIAAEWLRGAAEQGDREKPINYSADTGDVNYQTKVGNLTGNVVLSQGTMLIHADRITFRFGPLSLPPFSRRRRPAMTASPDGSTRATSNVGTPSLLCGGSGDAPPSEDTRASVAD